jgi:protein O-mannosyl-transferase
VVIVLAAIWFIRKKNLMAGFGILWYLISLSVVSNLFVQIGGAFLGERLIYSASLGFVLIVIYCIAYVIPMRLSKIKTIKKKNVQTAVVALLVLILVCFSVITISRNFAWKDNFTLFTTDVSASTKSIKGLSGAGHEYMVKANTENDPAIKKAYLKKARQYLGRALQLYPSYRFALADMGIVYISMNDHADSAVYYLMKALEQAANDKSVMNNINIAIPQLKNGGDKLKAYLDLYKLKPDDYLVNFNLGLLYFTQKAGYDKALFHFDKASKIKTGSYEPLLNIGIVNLQNNNFAEAKKYHEAALKLKPGDSMIISNLKFINNKIGK